MKSFISLCLMLLAGPALAAFPSAADIRSELDNSPVGARVQLGTQLTDKKVQVLRAQYDFAEQGGAIGTVNLLDVDGKKAVLPAGAIITDCLIHVVTVPGTATGTASLGFSTGFYGSDIQSVVASSPTYFVPDTLRACNITGSVATSVKLPGYTAGYTAGYTPTMTISGAALVQGKINVWLEYILGTAQGQ